MAPTTDPRTPDILSYKHNADDIVQHIPTAPPDLDFSATALTVAQTLTLPLWLSGTLAFWSSGTGSRIRFAFIVSLGGYFGVLPLRFGEDLCW